MSAFATPQEEPVSYETCRERWVMPTREIEYGFSSLLCISGTQVLAIALHLKIDV
jgi:hypothetical protein